jgi:hypothetical protein
MAARTAERDLWNEWVAPFLLGLIVEPIMSTYSKLPLPPRILVAVLVGVVYFVVYRRRQHRRPRAVEVTEPSKWRLALVVIVVVLVIVVNGVAAVAFGMALATLLVLAWLFVVGLTVRLASFASETIRLLVHQVAAVSLGAAVSIGAMPAVSTVAGPDGTWQLEAFSVIVSENVTTPSRLPAARWALAKDTACREQPCDYVVGVDLRGTGRTSRLRRGSGGDDVYTTELDFRGDCVDKQPPHRVIMTNGYRVHAVYRVEPTAYEVRAGQRRPTRLEVTYEATGTATAAARARNCPTTTGLSQRTIARRTD